MISSPVLAALQSTGGSGLPAWTIPVQVIGIGFVFWFLIIRPQSQERKKHALLLSQLKKGDEVMTVGGIIGTVKDIKEGKDTGETRVTVESGTAQVVVERSRIARIGSPGATGSTPST